jgi:hypothetical protein
MIDVPENKLVHLMSLQEAVVEPKTKPFNLNNQFT